MTIRKIRLYPDPILRQKCRPVDLQEIETAYIQDLVNDMVKTMYHFEGTVGLAACQVGEPVRIFVMDSTAKTTRDRLKVLINPTINAQSQWKYSREGCLSFPDYIVTVKRARKMILSWHTPAGEQVEEDLRDFEAIIAQHEFDHLEGILFLDRIKNINTDLIIRSHQPEQAVITD